MVRCYLSRFKQALTCLMLALPLWSGAQSGVNLPARIELHAIQSTTLTGDEFLRGGQQGKPAMLAGELRLPVGTSAKYPGLAPEIIHSPVVGLGFCRSTLHGPGVCRITLRSTADAPSSGICFKLIFILTLL